MSRMLKALQTGRFCNLTTFQLSVIVNITTDLRLIEYLPNVVCLSLREMVFYPETFRPMAERLASLPLKTLQMSDTNFYERLHMALQRTFPNLHTLILRNASLNSDDFRSLSQADAAGRLTVLQELDVSENERQLS